MILVSAALSMAWRLVGISFVFVALEIVLKQVWWVYFLQTICTGSDEFYMLHSKMMYRN